MLFHTPGSVVGSRTGCSIFRREVDGFRKPGTCHSSRSVAGWLEVDPSWLSALQPGRGQSAVRVVYEQSDRAYD